MNARALGLTMTVAAVLLAPAVVSAQIGIGPRISFVRGTDGRDEDSQTYFGGALRLGGGKAVLELALDYRSETTDRTSSETVTDYPFQASLIVFPIRSAFAPYLIGGVGWYSQKIEQLASAGARRTRRHDAKAGLPRRLWRRGAAPSEPRPVRRLSLHLHPLRRRRRRHGVPAGIDSVRRTAQAVARRLDVHVWRELLLLTLQSRNCRAWALLGLARAEIRSRSVRPT